MDESEFAELLRTKTSGETPEVDTEEDKPEAEVEEAPAKAEVSEDTAEDTAEDAEEAPAEEEVKEEEQLYAGRYKTIEDLERAVQEKEELITRQGNEVGELRSLVEQYHARTQAEIGQLRSDTFEPDEEWEEWADAEIMRGLETGEGDMTAIEAITAAGAEGGPEAARYVLKRWYELDPAAATTFQVQAVTQANALWASMQDPDVEQSSENGAPSPDIVAQAWEMVESRHVDVREYEDGMREALADLTEPDRERWEQKIAASPAAGEDFVEYLYFQARAREAEKKLSDRDAATAQARRAKADREAAGDTVASATASPSRAAPAPKVRGFDYEAFRREAGLTPRE